MSRNLNSKLIPAFFGGIFTILITYICFDGISIIFNANETYHWGKTTGVITSSEIVGECYTKNSHCQLVIQYSYTAHHMEYQGNSIYIGDHSVPSVGRAIAHGKKYMAKYPVGQKTMVYYDPQRPRNSVLENGVSQQTFGRLISGILIATGGILITTADRFVFQKLGKFRAFASAIFLSGIFLLFSLISGQFS
jgi:Protein of unknown function (DUF3592)